MRAVVIYESMYGNTHLIADAIASGLEGIETEVVPVTKASRERLAGADLLVVGGPTHVHGMTRAATRESAIETARRPGHELAVDPDAEGEGLREWFAGCGALAVPAAAFDTRVAGPVLLTGRASKGIAKQLTTHGCAVLAEPESFLVTRDNHLEPHEAERAHAWGRELAKARRAWGDSGAVQSST